MSARAPSGMAGRRTAASGDVDFIVVGGGVIGTAMAGLLVARGLAARGRVAVIADQAAAPARTGAVSDSDWDLRVFALSRASHRILELCGAWRALPPPKRCAYERMCVWEARNGEAVGGQLFGAGSLTFDCAAIGEPNLGFIVEGRALQSACRGAAAAAGVVFIEGALEGITVGDAGLPVRQLESG
jgi:2-polyprenylphenol 6-hydroxylase